MSTSEGPAALYRRYRPARFDQLVGQDAVATSLTSAIAGGRIGHAYLFSGPRGTGKTTTARIFAKAMNCTELDGVEPCNTCASCTSITVGNSMDVIEIDAASNNGVDHVRELTSRAALGSAGRHKVFVVDEVHMLSTAASNALLKTLEEPPPHVVFILATTDPNKLLATVRSRTNHLEFRLVNPQTLSDHLRSVAADAGLSVTDRHIAEAVRRAKGSVRDALSALDVLAGADLDSTGDPSVQLIRSLLELDVAATLRTVAEQTANGAEPRRVAEEALDLLREMFLVQMGAAELATHADIDTISELARAAGPKMTVKLMDAFGEAIIAIRGDHEPRIAVEVSLARHCRTERLAATAAA